MNFSIIFLFMKIYFFCRKYYLPKFTSNTIIFNIKIDIRILYQISQLKDAVILHLHLNNYIHEKKSYILHQKLLP